jgi:hypothetical protein
MSEHHSNPTALIAATLPTWPPPNRIGGVQVITRPAPKRHVYIVAPGGHHSEDADAGRKAHAEACAKAGIAQELHTLGEPLPVEKCDVVLTLLSQWGDLSSIGPGRQPREGHHILPGEVARYDMREFLAHSEASLPEEKRIVSPLGLVK